MFKYGKLSGKAEDEYKRDRKMLCKTYLKLANPVRNDFPVDVFN